MACPKIKNKNQVFLVHNFKYLAQLQKKKKTFFYYLYGITQLRLPKKSRTMPQWYEGRKTCEFLCSIPISSVTKWNSSSYRLQFSCNSYFHFFFFYWKRKSINPKSLMGRNGLLPFLENAGCLALLIFLSATTKTETD